MSEDSDLRIRQNQPANQVVLQITLERSTERFFGEVSPRFLRNLIIELFLHLIFGNERLQHRIPSVLGEDAREMVKPLHLVELALAPGKIDNRPPAQPLIDVAN